MKSKIFYFFTTLFITFVARASAGVFGRDVTADMATVESRLSIQEAKHTVAIISRKNANKFICAGTLVREDLVVTSAQCLSDDQGKILPTDDIRVYAGVNKLNDLNDNMYLDAMRIGRHEKYENINNTRFSNNIGYIKLESFFNSSDAIGVIKFNDSTPTDGEKCIIYGWGTRDPSGMIDFIFRQAILPIVSKTTCNEAYTNASLPLHSNTLCAGETGVGICEGEMGGALVCDKMFTGIVSHSNGCGLKDFPGVFTDVRLYEEWIYTNGSNNLSSSFIFVVLIVLTSTKSLETFL